MLVIVIFVPTDMFTWLCSKKGPPPVTGPPHPMGPLLLPEKPIIQPGDCMNAVPDVNEPGRAGVTAAARAAPGDASVMYAATAAEVMMKVARAAISAAFRIVIAIAPFHRLMTLPII